MEMRDPDARNGKMWPSRAAGGRNGRARLHLCVDWMVPPSGSWPVIGNAVRVKALLKSQQTIASNLNLAAGYLQTKETARTIPYNPDNSLQYAL
jgi:hypothetical protein